MGCKQPLVYPYSPAGRSYQCRSSSELLGEARRAALLCGLAGGRLCLKGLANSPCAKWTCKCTSYAACIKKRHGPAGPGSPIDTAYNLESSSTHKPLLLRPASSSPLPPARPSRVPPPVYTVIHTLSSFS